MPEGCALINWMPEVTVRPLPRMAAKGVVPPCRRSPNFAHHFEGFRSTTWLDVPEMLARADLRPYENPMIDREPACRLG